MLLSHAFVAMAASELSPDCLGMVSSTHYMTAVQLTETSSCFCNDDYVSASWHHASLHQGVSQKGEQASCWRCSDSCLSNVFSDSIFPPLPANYNNSKFVGTHFPITGLPAPYSSNKLMNKYFQHYTSVFGIPIFANEGLSKNNGLWKMSHVANVLGQVPPPSPNPSHY